jgi:hypothetical protein
MSEEVQTPVEENTEVSETVMSQPEVATQQPVSMLGDDGSFNNTWLEQLPEELGNHSIWKKYSNPVDLAKGAINAQTMAGKKAEEFWKSEEPNDIAKRNEIMGIPASADAYNIQYQAPEGVDVDEERINAFKQIAFENGLSEKAANSLIAWEIEKTEQALKDYESEYEQSLDQAEAELREVWKGDDYEYNVAKVTNAMDYLDLGEFKEDPGIANNAKFIKALYDKIVPLIDNDELIESKNQDNYAVLTDQLVELEQKMYNYKGPTHDTAYRMLIEERGKLLEKAREQKLKIS